ncbi:MAG TPA: threonine--tRNA ligase [Ignavibacteria bacterium]|nr:threonine--tRNA ligase [Ignavibacteria bacterium]HRB01135.1 threonine--tRNA ligase [Ignavibacteria bacterium]
MSDKIKITFPDNTVKEFDKGISAYDIAASISQRLADEILAAEINGKMKDISLPLNEDAKVVFHKFDSDKGKEVYWHTTSHMMAQAIEELFPGARFGVGPPIESGFYYDIDSDRKFTEEDLKKIEDKILEISKRDLKPERKDIKRLDAIEFFKSKREDPYKVEILETIAKDEDEVSLYSQGEFTDLCRGPHLPSTEKVKSVKLLSVSGSYWRGDEKRQMLQRIYGISFPKQKELDEYLKNLEEAKKRDHRKLGKELDLFSFHEEGPGFPFWHNNGMVLLNNLKEYLRAKLAELDYQEINTPIILNQKLWQQSGHYDNYKENMYFTDIDERDYAVKPMNCPGSTLVYKTGMKSYRDLPLRLYEFGLVHRHELSGVLNGLFRVRSFTQDDAHVFCTPDQIEEEVTILIKLVFEIYDAFGFDDVQVYLSTRPEKYIGSTEVWDNSEKALATALEKAEIKYKINEGDGAFYGPKIDFVVKDSLRRNWQLGTIQLDFSMPGRFGLEYVGSDGNTHVPVMIHRAIFGSFERFVGVLTEHYGGYFPLWLAPVQVSVLPIADAHFEYADAVSKKLREKGFRVFTDKRNEKVGYKIRESENRKIPYMLVIGDKEVEGNEISVREHKKGDTGKFELKDFIEKINLQVLEKAGYN